MKKKKKKQRLTGIHYVALAYMVGIARLPCHAAWADRGAVRRGGGGPQERSI